MQKIKVKYFNKSIWYSRLSRQMAKNSNSHLEI